MRSMWGRRRFTAALGAGLALPAAAQFRVEISGIGDTQVPVALGPFYGENFSKVPLSEVIRADLERSGLFRVVEAPPGLDERRPLPAGEGPVAGAEALLAGSVSRDADGTYDVRFRLWDAVRRQPLVDGKLPPPVLESELRLAAHRIADVVFEKLTGQRGVFATRIAYVTRSGRRHVLRVADADGAGDSPLLTSDQPIISPAWAPNGRELAYVSFEDEKAVVWSQELISGKRERVANFRGSNSAPAWSPDGSEFALTLSRDAVAQIYLLSRRPGSVPRRLTTSASIDTEPAFAPDGRTLYFVSDRGGGPQIYRMPVAGGNAERVTFEGSYNISPAISPDGRLLAYVTRQGGAFKLCLLDLSRGVVTQLSDTSEDESPSFAPNGRLILFATRMQGRDVLMTTTTDGRIKSRLVTSGLDMLEPAWGPYRS
jgi:TolB protein